ncbi:MAG: hypothetical protein U0872_15045 [Planctomycetaceae bacterium]
MITRLSTGEDRKFYYLNNADSYHGKVRLRIEQDGGGRVVLDLGRVDARRRSLDEAGSVPARRRLMFQLGDRHANEETPICRAAVRPWPVGNPSFRNLAARVSFAIVTEDRPCRCCAV